MSMEVVRSTGEWVARFGETRKGTAVTIGNFDGVHRGHQEILRRVLERAQTTDLIASVLTFYPHPARVLRPAEAPSLLNTLNQRLAAIEAARIEAAFVMRFDRELASLSPEDFVRQFLVDAMGARAIFIGGNFRFGHRQSGDATMLAEMGERWGFDVDIVPPVIEGGVVISSTAIRKALRDGDVEEATRMLGRPFALAAEIRTGTGQGRKLVVPTLNLVTEQEMLPKNGVYATRVKVGGKIYRAVTNVGVRPTFDGARITVESHLFDFSQTLTSGPMEVAFCRRLRDERKFSGPAELREQVLRDIENAKDYFQESEAVPQISGSRKPTSQDRE
jgi:riboflavin kinase/FMN adenylyltransferase